MITIIHTKDKKYLFVEDKFFDETFKPVPKEDIDTDDILYQTDLDGKIIWEHPDRKVIEKYLYKYIARDKDGDLYAYKEVPIRRTSRWVTANTDDVSSFIEITYLSDLYPHVKWEDDKPYENPHFQAKTSAHSEGKNY